MNEVTTVAPAPSTLASFIERAARDDSFDVDKFAALLRMQREEQHEAARRAFDAAMAACQAEMEPVIRRGVNEHTHSKYAKLEAIDEQMRPIYTRHGFSVRFGSAQPPHPGWMRITCTVAHEAGYREENYLDSPVSTTGSQGGKTAMTPVQGVGSVVTYLRRYLLGMVFNIVQADVVGPDNDGVTGGGSKSPRQPGWQVWIDKLQAALAPLATVEAVEAFGGRKVFTDNLEHAPLWARDEAMALLAEARARCEGYAKSEAGGWQEPHDDETTEGTTA